MSDTSSLSSGSSITLLLGGVRAGKSARALALAESFVEPKTGHPDTTDVLWFVATAQAFDDEMTRRIAAHRAERAERWHTIEEPVALVATLEAALAIAAESPRVIVIDCLTLWVSNLLLASDDATDIEGRMAEQAAALTALMQRTTSVRWILVSNEVGLGVVPPTPLGRVYRDALGRVNQIVAAAADTVELMVAGLVMPLKAPTGQSITATAESPAPDAPRS
ncbi:bifunctional adenosylcobinamide kinase/adenosylcobinamide-phosphate guanylyltransferase [Gemmatimonas aurantiaca]|uniref:bifunctional adenosylcobinamide kinase/adenosylcobinamide-phosphate guanylyltransferase n=1 Tax=Gemmatimonas aurantiaca TaxID=173480 RepID=UPI00301C823F